MLDDIKKAKTIANVAPLRNVMLLGAAIQQLRDRDPDLPGMGCFHGFSGYGKSSAAIYNAQVYNACWVEVKSVWTRKVLVTKIVKALGMEPSGQISDMVEQIGEELAKSGRPLLIDEAHKLCRDDMMGVIHDIYISSLGSAMILIGEEVLPQRLRRWERVHNRIGAWPAAQPADLRETRVLAQLKQPQLTLPDDVLQVVLEKSAANFRRVVANLNQVNLYSLTSGRSEITMADVPKIEFFLGEAPTPRRGMA
ncbi:AAA family ATPase [Rhodobacter capsulatus]|uniref:AAA family ATPase n=1 Tax=Rhodobacter capsulatus TaxID=1061 RepID=UPI00402549EE